MIVPNNFYDIEINEKVLKSDLSKLDIRILQTCLGIQKQVPENEPVILVSKKASLRKKAEMLGIKAQTFRDELLPELNEQYSGRKLLKVSDEKVKKFRENGKLQLLK